MTDNTTDPTREAIAQVISDSFYAMEAGEMPVAHQQNVPNAGEMQLAVDILASGLVVTTAEADELRRQLEFKSRSNARLAADYVEAERDRQRVMAEADRREREAWAKGNDAGFEYGYEKGHHDPDFTDSSDAPVNPFALPITDPEQEQTNPNGCTRDDCYECDNQA